LDPETQKPKVKLYHHKGNKKERMVLKGDAQFVMLIWKVSILPYKY